MLTSDENERLTRVGPGTPMGELLRRYWLPIGAVGQLEKPAARPLRLLGEDLVLYKDLSGAYGLVSRRCPHRGADLSNGIVEQCGLRCSYHGWHFDREGRCTSLPFEDRIRPGSKFKDKIRVTAYRVAAKAGLLWAYLGPDPAPELWDWAIFHEPAYKTAIITHVPCNWLQCQENSIDPIHFEWLHTNWPIAQSGSRSYGPTHTALDFKEFEFGFTYHRIVEGSSEEDERWSVGRVCLWPNCLYANAFTWHTPIDDLNTLTITLTVDQLPGDAPFIQEEVPFWEMPIVDEHGRVLKQHLGNQDALTWIGQGRIADRTLEHLAESDRGVIMFRRCLVDNLEAVAAGRDPKGIVRDATSNQRIPLPRAKPLPVLGAVGRPPRLRPMWGQPQAIVDDMNQVWKTRAGA